MRGSEHCAPAVPRHLAAEPYAMSISRSLVAYCWARAQSAARGALVQSKRSSRAHRYTVLTSDSVVEHRVLSRELDDLQSGAIRKATVAPGEGGASPAEGDLVRRRTAPCCRARAVCDPRHPAVGTWTRPGLRARPVPSAAQPERDPGRVPVAGLRARRGARGRAHAGDHARGRGRARRAARARAGQGPPRAARLGARAAGCPPARTRQGTLQCFA